MGYEEKRRTGFQRRKPLRNLKKTRKSISYSCNELVLTKQLLSANIFQDNSLTSVSRRSSSTPNISSRS